MRIVKNNLLCEYENAGGNVNALNNKETNHLVINENKVISSNKTDELDLKVIEEKDGISLNLTVKKDVHVKEPVYLCFGIIEKRKVQNIKINMLFEKNSSAKLLAHCIFPNAVNITHNMDAKIVLKEKSTLSYEEVHYHGDNGVISVNPKAEIFQEEGSTYLNRFSLLKGIAGKVLFYYTAHLGKGAKCELTARVNAIKNDDVKIIEKALLEGSDSNALLNTRIVLSDASKGIVENTIIGLGNNSRGHMDCVEIINGEEAVARAIPLVEVKNKTSKITHEAAIGSVDKTSLNTLMSRGLTQEEAVRVIINGLLR
ncbi:Uncharacterised protein [Candidatus Tiddalikarchaeum anstoanum]|nr:Uncharacterised protein [Candidatus Tiddalikarchaeum anstoanum]